MAQLTPEEICEAAVALLDIGPEALSMRSLADRLGVTAAALYYWFPSKADLLDAVAVHLSHQIAASQEAGATWQEEMKAFALGLVDVAADHPGAFAWMMRHYATHPVLAPVDEALLDILLGAGFSPTDALLAKGAVVRFVIGHLGLAGQAASVDPSGLSAQEHPRLYEVAVPRRRVRETELLEHGLECLLQGIALASSPTVRNGTRRRGGGARRARHNPS